MPGLGPHVRGHVFLFDSRPLQEYDAAAGARLLIAAAAVELLRLVLVSRLLPRVPLWLLAPLLLGCALAAIRFVAGLRLPQVGLRRWSAWTLTEKSYFLQVLVLANIVFPVVLAAPLRERLGQGPVASTLWSVFVPYLFFGFYQEVVYRGMLQRELVRRWGAPAGILVANVLYTFGPLHAGLFWKGAAHAIPMLAATFLIGLFFGVLFRRSGNLGMVAIFHAVGNAYIVGSLG